LEEAEEYASYTYITSCRSVQIIVIIIVEILVIKVLILVHEIFLSIWLLELEILKRLTLSISK